jgi:hypothetical protein
VLSSAARNQLVKNFKMNVVRLFFAALCSCVANAQAVDEAQVAKAFDVPVSSIRRTVKTDEVVSKHGDSIHSASLFEFESEPNVSMQVVVTKGHFLLTDSLKIKLEGEPVLIEKVDLGNGGKAFVGDEGSGPGAEGYVAIGHLPSQNVDFRFRVMVSNDGATASDVPALSTLRSSPLLKAALRTLAISSSAKLSQDLSLSSAPMAQRTQPLEPLGNPNSNAQGMEKVTTEKGPERTLPEQKNQEWKKPFGLALAGTFSLLLIAFYWKKRKSTNHRREGYRK